MTLPNTNAVTVTGRPDGVDLHVDGYTRTTLKDLIGLLAKDDDLRERFFDLFEPPAETDPHAAAVADRDEQFLDQVMPDLPTTIRLYRGPLAHLTDQLTTILGRRTGWFPRQQNRRAA